MLINGWNASEIDAKLWTVSKGVSSIANDSEWGKGMISPALFKSNAGFKELKLTFMVYGNSREEIHNKISILTSKFKGVVDLTLDKWTHKFKGVLKSTPTISEITATKKRFAKVTYTFQVYEYSNELTFTGRTRIEFNNPGTALTPVKLVLSSIQGAGTITISGLNEEIKIPVQPDHTYIIDGETGLITDNGQLMDLDIWELPYAKNGQNILSASSSFAGISVIIKPRYI